MENNKTISFRVNYQTEKNIEEIRKQIEKNPLFKDFEITDSYIIRLAISTLNEKFKDFVLTK